MRVWAVSERAGEVSSPGCLAGLTACFTHPPPGSRLRGHGSGVKPRVEIWWEGGSHVLSGLSGD